MSSITKLLTRSEADVSADDAKLLHKVRRALVASGCFKLQTIGIGAREGHVSLRGSVSTYYQKQLAQEAVRRVCDVESLNNEITVAINPSEAINTERQSVRNQGY